MNKEDIKKRIVEIIARRVTSPHYKVFFFGSRVNGKADERSDIDIGMQVAKGSFPPGEISDLKDELEEKLPILQKIDLVDFNHLTDDFKKVALQNIEMIYEQ